MSDPCVDIGIPVFNRSNYVARAIESVLSQSYTNWQLTVSEELGPTEPVMRAIQPYLADERVRYLPIRGRLGVARHKSSLVALGQGKYVGLLDDDDRWLSDWLARRVEFLETHPPCVFVWGGHLDIDSDGIEIRRVPLPLAGGVHSPREFVATMMKGNIVGTPDVLFRREAYVRAGNAFDDRFLHIDDYELWLRMGLLGPVGFLPVHDAEYRVHSQQRSRRHDRALDHFYLIDHVDGLVQKANLDLRLSATERRRQKADRLLSAALDAAEAGHTRTAARRIVRAAGLAPRALVSRRGLGALAGALGGEKLSRRIGAMRS